MEQKITTLFCDVGGVLLTNGWGRTSRAKAVKKFGLDSAEFEERHQLIFGDYEAGKIDLEEYLHRTIFFLPRTFSYEDFIDFMYEQSEPHEEVIDLLHKIKKKYRLKFLIVSNEGREIMEYRIDKFRLTELADIFVVSSFIGIRKPDKKMFQIALDLSQAVPEQVVYIDDRELFVEIARDMGIQGIKHTSKSGTEEALNSIIE